MGFKFDAETFAQHLALMHNRMLRLLGASNDFGGEAGWGDGARESQVRQPVESQHHGAATSPPDGEAFACSAEEENFLWYVQAV